MAEDGNEKGIWTTEEVAAEFKVSRDTILRERKKGRIKGGQVGRQWRFESDEVQRYRDLIFSEARNALDALDAVPETE